MRRVDTTVRRQATSGDDVEAVVRPLRAGDDGAVRRIFRATVALGGPLPFPASSMTAYESLCLDWYLGPGRADGLVAEEGGEVVGYLLACLDEAAFQRWQRRAAARWVTAVTRDLVLGRLRGRAVTFVGLRLLDGWASWRHGPEPPFPGHVHTNLDARARGRRTFFRMLDAFDERCRRLGVEGIYGEVNAPRGRSRHRIGLEGAEVVHVVENRTLTWLAGAAVDRLTVARPTPAAGP